ncbi:hypothetical protein K1T71_011817 [Dendrolimus kikuchii]|uniref:Uncharacterized protein n=1 Tax=Dendrolimus kikuchii TaxID=765133 RepID=A0ACC1CMB6_9NEOP|nr:hypothetical protein K1T71_011817 [Dendrolimus kikuchii]
MSPNPSNGEENNYVSIFTHESSPQSSPERNLSIQKPTENVNVNYPTSSQKSNKNDLDSDSFESVESNQSMKSPIFVNVHENESSDDSICEYDSQDLSELNQFEQKIISQTSPTEMHKIDDNLPDNIGKNDVIKINDEAYNAERDIISEGKYSSRDEIIPLPDKQIHFQDNIRFKLELEDIPLDSIHELMDRAEEIQADDNWKTLMATPSWSTLVLYVLLTAVVLWKVYQWRNYNQHLHVNSTQTGNEDVAGSCKMRFQLKEGRGEVELRISTGINEDQPSEESRQLQQLNQDRNHDLEGVQNEDHDFVVQGPSSEGDEDDFPDMTEDSVGSHLERDRQRPDQSDRQDDFYDAEDNGHERLIDIQEPKYFLRDRDTLRCPERYNDFVCSVESFRETYNEALKAG